MLKRLVDNIFSELFQHIHINVGYSRSVLIFVWTASNLDDSVNVVELHVKGFNIRTLDSLSLTNFTHKFFI